MAYRESRAPFDELGSVINELFERRETLIIKTEVPRRLSWRLREVLHCCQFHDDLKKYLPLIKLYAFETHSTHVRARYRGSDDITSIEVRPGDHERTRTAKGPRKQGPRETPAYAEPEINLDVDEVARAVDTARLENVTNLAGIIDGTKRYGIRTMEVYFPDARITEEDKARLYRWTSENGWALIDMEGAGITLSKHEISEELQWLPR